MRMRISPHAFFQTNTEMAERLYRLAIDYAQPAGSDRLYDLYCGIGTIGLLMAPRVAEVWGLEIVEEAIADAIANARLNEVDNAQFFAGDVRLALRELVERAGRPDVLVVDPPRVGPLAEGRAPDHRGRARRIVYVSCNPTTLAPNAAQLVEAAATACAGCGRSTCSRRRRTSSAWRCWSAPSRVPRRTRHARGHDQRQEPERRGPPRPDAGRRRGPGARQGRRAERRRHDAAARPAIPRHRARRRTSRGSSSPARWSSAAPARPGSPRAIA